MLRPGVSGDIAIKDGRIAEMGVRVFGVVAMFKIIMTIRKREDLSPQEFMAYYENHHAPLVHGIMRNVPVYRRNYIDGSASVAGIPGGGPDMAGYDCISEICFATREEAERHFTTLVSPANRDRTVADEANFIAPDGLQFYIVQVFESPI
jgi:hypothetical protein